MNRPKQTGMTLIELVVTVTIVAILSAVALPSLKEMIESNRLTALNNQLVSSLNYVRGEAVKRAYDVTMCVRADPDGNPDTDPECASSGGFEDGWIVFVNCNPISDTPPNAPIPPAPDTATNVCDFNGDGVEESPEPILLDTTPDFRGVTVTSNSSSPRIINYRPNGNVSSAGTLTLGTEGAGEMELDFSLGSIPRYKIIIAPLTGRIRSCKIKPNTTGC